MIRTLKNIAGELLLLGMGAELAGSVAFGLWLLFLNLRA